MNAYRMGLAALALTLWMSCVGAQPSAADVAAYRAAFDAGFPKLRTLEEGRQLATAATYDELMLEQRLPGLLGLDPGIDGTEAWSKAYDYLKLNQDAVTNENSAMAWGLSYDHLSLNQMARATGEPKYLAASWLVARAVADARDNVRGLKLYTGETAPAWGCSKYVEEGRSVHAVHTGVIAFPVLELLLLLRDAPSYEGKPDADTRNAVLEAMVEALEFHDPQWREGPLPEEGHYVGLNQEPVLNGKVLPANRLAAMGRALLLVHDLTGDAGALDKAVRMGHYLKNRISAATDLDAFVWPYTLALDDRAEAKPWAELTARPQGEDISHASLTASLPMLLHARGHVFDHADAQRFARTVTEVFAREGDGVLYTNVDGMPRKEANPGLLVLPGRWLRIAPDDARAYALLEEFILTRDTALRPLDLANLIRYRPKAAE